MAQEKYKITPREFDPNRVPKYLIGKEPKYPFSLPIINEIYSTRPTGSDTEGKTAGEEQKANTATSVNLDDDLADLFE